MREAASSKMSNMHRIVITDLDGTLLDHSTYDYRPALPALEFLRKKRVPVVFCSSKTAAEIISLRLKMRNTHPFIVENGGGLYWPRGYFRFSVKGAQLRGDYEVVPLAESTHRLEKELRAIANKVGVTIRSFADMTADEVAKITTLSLEEAKLAMQREFSLPFTTPGLAHTVLFGGLSEAVERLGLKLREGGRFLHLSGKSDKGEAARRLIDLYRRQWKNLQSVGMGDSLNDLDLLRAVDLPIVVPNPRTGAPLTAALPGARRAPAPGPEGWKAAILLLWEAAAKS